MAKVDTPIKLRLSFPKDSGNTGDRTLSKILARRAVYSKVSAADNATPKRSFAEMMGVPLICQSIRS